MSMLLNKRLKLIRIAPRMLGNLAARETAKRDFQIMREDYERKRKMKNREGAKD